MRRQALTALTGGILALCSSLALAGGLLVVAPHPDDDLLIAAGLVANAKARGDQVKVVFMTNGDIYGELFGATRQVEAVGAQTQNLGTLESDLIFLGYPDSGLATIVDAYPNVTDAFTGANGRTTTYGTHGLGLADYHTYRFGGAALYNRANIVADLQDIIDTYRPDHILTTAEYDKHPDHVATYQMVKAAVDAVIAAAPSYNPSLHKTVVWADTITNAESWPLLPGPTIAITPPPGFESVLPWSERESIEVPVAMQSQDFSTNPKYLAISTHTSQGGVNSILGRFIHKDEIFWDQALAGGATLPPRAVASGPATVAMGASVQLSAAGSYDPGAAALTYTWRQVAGPLVMLVGANTATPTFQAPVGLFADATLGFELVVGNGTKNSLPNLVAVPVLVSTTNIAPLATASASSENTADGQVAQRAIDGVADGYPGDSSHEWSSNGERAGAWLQLQWAAPVTITRIALFDRPNDNDYITSGTLSFSDGSSIAVAALPNGFDGLHIPIPPRTVSWVRFTVDTVAVTTENVGLAEFMAFGFTTNQVPVANAGSGGIVVAGHAVQLDGSRSTDVEQQPLTYGWVQTDGPAVTLSSTTDARPTFIAPAGPSSLRFALTVNDGQFSSAPSSVDIAVLSADDNDHNGMADAWESMFGVTDPNADPDGDGLTNLQEFTLGSSPIDAAPIVVIAAPAAATITKETVIHFAATATDAEDGNLNASIQWRSSISGPIGTGPTLDRTLPPGIHTITATVVDSKGAQPVSIPSRQLEVLDALRNGDIDGNGKIDFADVLRLQQYLAGTRSLTSAEIARGDLYPAAGGDGVLDLADLVLLERLLTN